MNKALREAPGVALRCLLDGAIWSALVRAVLSWSVLGRVVGAIVLLIVGWFVTNLFPWVLRDLLRYVLDFFLTLWLLPPAVRRACAIIVPRALGTDPDTPHLPDVAAYRGWWMPFLLATSVLPDFVTRFVEPYDLVNTRLLGLAVFAVQVWAARSPVVRGVLAPVLPRVDVDAALAVRRGLWLLVTLGYMVIGACVFVLATAISGGGGDVVLGGLSAVLTHHLLSFVLLRAALALATLFAVEILCTAALARIAIGIAAPDGIGEDDGTVSSPSAAPVPTRRAAASTPAPTPTRKRHVEAPRQAFPWGWSLLAAVVVVLAGGYAARAQLVYVVLDHDQLPDEMSLRAWLNPQVRSLSAWTAACHGEAGNLRKMLRAGIVPDDFEHHDVLGCAAQNAHLDAVKALVDARHDVNALARPIDARPYAAPLSPLQQALRTPAGIPVADYLLAHGASFRPDGPGAVDAAQVAAAWGCLPCLEWLKQHGAPMDATAPATPLALWFDNPAELDREGDNSLANLIAIGLSPTAVGADGRSALHAAAAAGNDAAVRLLLAKGADPALADADGMKPVFYAASPPGRRHGVEERTAHARRMAVIADLLAVTPSLVGQGTPASPRRAVVMADPYIDSAFDFGMAGAQHADIRAAALAAGQAIPYKDGTFITRLPPDEAHALLARMSDADIATTMTHGSVLALVTARNADWPDLARAARGWPQRRPDETSYDVNECEVLKLAIDGAGDTSRDAADSWAVVDGWLAINKAERCSDVTAGLARRSAAQRADWQVRTQP